MRERGSKGASLHASNRSCWFSSRRTQLWPQITSADKFDFPNNKLILACKIGDFLNHTSRGSIFCIGATWSNQQFSNLIPVILASQNDLSNPLSDPNQQTNALSSSSPNSRRYFLRRTEVGCTWPSSRYKMTWRGWSLDSTWKSYCLDPRWFVWPHFGQLTVLLFRASVFKWAVKVLVQLESHSQWWIQFQYCSCFHYKMVSALCLYSSTHRVHDPNWLRIFLVQFFSTWSGWMRALRFKVKGCSWKVQNSKFLGRWTWNVNSFLVLNEKKSICRSQVDTDLYSGNPWSYMGIIEKDSAILVSICFHDF